VRYLVRPDTAIALDATSFRKAYEWLLTAPAGFGVDIAERIVTGCFVVLHERFKPVAGKPASDAGAVIYEVDGRHIRRVWFATP
jgi:hypothetical protein